MRNPKAAELYTKEFQAVWNVIKHWDIGLPEDVTETGHQLYSGATGNHVVVILDALKETGCLLSKKEGQP